MMKRLKIAVVGAGFIGLRHMEIIRRISSAELVGITDIDNNLAKKYTRKHFIPKCYNTLDELLMDEEVDVVHNCTPNNLHLEVNERIIKAGKHVFSEKPLAMNSEESTKLLQLLDRNRNIVHGMNYNYRMNPLVQDMKSKIKKDEIGRPILIHGSYLQDWLLFDTDYNWRIEPEICGPSRCISDIGTHWMDTVQTIVGSKIVEVCGDLLTVFPKRKKPKAQVDTFSKAKDTEYEEIEVKTEDYGAVMFKMNNGVRGNFCVSQVSAGRKGYLNFEIDGTKSSMYWNQEVPDFMWMGFKEKNNNLVIRSPELMEDEARQYTSIPGGHPEGWNDAMRNNIYSFYKFILENKKIHKDTHDFASFIEGHYLVQLTEAILKSNRTRQWVKV